ncbi:hypothetical protein Taro_028008 [Colocasia esculenta]|uniref:Pentatricopeptide repeat-containing protein n=1 Tax=Colocasia esculenta TaxID=4460 RepID=A0A843VP54_COLES|nr:hypothetical protein [Colocasia esculenta]
MISSYAQHGCAEHSLSLFKKMKDHGFTPNSVAFLGVLTACSHGGLSNEGLGQVSHYCLTASCFFSIYSVTQRILADAEDFIMSSGCDSDPVIWKALLCSCQLYGDIDRGNRVAERIVELEHQESACMCFCITCIWTLESRCWPIK